MKHDNWPVIEDDSRPAGVPDRCFYCNEPHGSQHKIGCAIRQRTVVVRAIIEYVVDVPEDWEQHDIEFHRNDGSWCADNALTELDELSERAGCLCAVTRYEYLREATKEDEEMCFWPDDPHQPEARAEVE